VGEVNGMGAMRKLRKEILNPQLLNGTVPSPQTLALAFAFSISYSFYRLFYHQCWVYGVVSDNKGTLVIMTSMKQDSLNVCR
jgi:hypothetical protein